MPATAAGDLDCAAKTLPDRAELLLHALPVLGSQDITPFRALGNFGLNFVASGLTSNRDDRAITQAVIGMAHTLGLVVVAEGVETSAQLDMLGEMGCDEAQGHLTGPPMSGHEITTRLHRRSPAGAPADSGQRTAGPGTAHAMSSKEDSS